MTQSKASMKDGESKSKQGLALSPDEKLRKTRQRLAELEHGQKLGLVRRRIPDDVEARLRDEIPVLARGKEPPTQHRSGRANVGVVAEDVERLVKSTERVRDLGEVFTPAATVEDILDMLPAGMWAVHPSPTFLEPACGDGNFLIAILTRKLAAIAKAYGRSKLPAGDGEDAALFHALEALASIYAVDISVENIVGGTPGHEIGARTRLLSAFTVWAHDVLHKRLTDRSPVLRAATWIVDHNLIVGNMLPFDVTGKPTGRNAIPLIEYDFTPEDLGLRLRMTTLGDVLDAAQAETAVKLSLFGPAEPVEFWNGRALKLADAERVEAPKLKGPARNGHGGCR